MHDGRTKLVQDIVVGDLLMGPDSNPRTVLSLARGREEMFRVTPDRGDSWTCNRSHILSLRMSSDNGDTYSKDEIINISIDDYLTKGIKFKHHAKQWATGVEFPQKNTPIDPYLLGLWLGDGTLSKPEITNCEPEIGEYLSRHLPTVRKDDKNNTYTFYLSNNPLLHEIKQFQSAGTKFIPSEYKVNNRQNRMALLAGLLDTDGYNSKNELFEITTKYETLKNDIAFLARSLGFSVTCSLEEKGIKSTGFKGMYWRIFIKGDIETIPLLTRKKALGREKRTNHLNTGFRLDSMGDGDYYGFTLDGDHLFMLGDFTVTHNTALALQICANVAKSGASIFFSLEMDRRQLKQRLYSLESEIPISKLSFINEGRKAAIDARFTSYNLYIDDTNGLDINSLMNRAIAFNKQRKLDIIAVDYLQIINSGGGRSKAEEVGAVSEKLKTLAKEIGCPVLALAQMNRNVEGRLVHNKKDSRPMMSDLADSSATEKWADQVIFMQRPYLINKERPGEVDFFVVKNRHGDTKDFKLGFSGELTKFYDMKEEQGL
jgi:replicative DNA helicase